MQFWVFIEIENGRLCSIINLMQMLELVALPDEGYPIVFTLLRMRVAESWLSWGFYSTLIGYHHLGSNERKLSTTLKKHLSRFKFHESAREAMRVAESACGFRPNESESLNSQQLSSSFGLGFTGNFGSIFNIYKLTKTQPLD